MMPTRLTTLMLIACLGALPACGDDEAATGTRGAPTTAKSTKKKDPKAKKKSKRQAQGGEEEVVEEIPDHPKRVLTREDFAAETRDPFQHFLGNEGLETEAAPRDVQRQRDVRLDEYNFEDLKLIGIVMSGRGIQPRALFVASDGKSKSVKQGEYFSRAEVLLAAVNRDYIEIEVVDEELAKGLNMATGERRPVYLKKD